MAILSKGQTFSSGDQVTSIKLNDLVDDASFVTGTGNATDNSTLEVHASGYLKVKDLGIDTGQLAADAVTTAKIDDGAVTSAKLATDAVWAAGMVMPYAGTSTPSGWVVCDGSAVSRTTYATLFSAISTTYGTGDGSTTFNLPDLTGRTVAGKESSATRLTPAGSGVDGATLGASGGAETHTLTESQMPAHIHALPLFDTGPAGGGFLAGYPRTATVADPSNMNAASTGGGTAHANVQPTLVLNYIIKT